MSRSPFARWQSASSASAAASPGLRTSSSWPWVIALSIFGPELRSAATEERARVERRLRVRLHVITEQIRRASGAPSAFVRPRRARRSTSWISGASFCAARS